MQNLNIQSSQGGFTLIELVIVIVLLGILAAVAVPRFVDLSAEAGNASAQGVAGAIASGSAINFAACKAGDTANCLTIDDTTTCTSLTTGANSLLDGGLPDDVSWVNGSGTVGSSGTGCSLSHSSGDTNAQVTVILTD